MTCRTVAEQGTFLLKCYINPSFSEITLSITLTVLNNSCCHVSRWSIFLFYSSRLSVMWCDVMLSLVVDVLLLLTGCDLWDRMCQGWGWDATPQLGKQWHRSLQQSPGVCKAAPVPTFPASSPLASPSAFWRPLQSCSSLGEWWGWRGDTGLWTQFRHIHLSEKWFSSAAFQIGSAKPDKYARASLLLYFP